MHSQMEVAERMGESSSEAQAKNTTQTFLISCFLQPLSIFIILANVFIILGILFNHKLHSTTNWFFLSLLFADLLAGAALPWIPQLSIERDLDYHSCFFRHVAPNFFFLAFLANLLVVHYAKYVFIIHPLHYNSSWVHRWAGLYILLAWAAPLILACLPLVWNQWAPKVKCSFRYVFPTPYLYLETYGFLIPAILVMAFMCIQVLCVAQRQVKNITRLIHSVNQGQAPSELEQQLELRIVKSTASVSLIFLICWVPYIACLNISLLSLDLNISPLLLTIVICIGTGSAAAVPVILSLGNRQYTEFWTDIAIKVWRSYCQRQGCKERQAKPKTNLPHGHRITTERDSNETPGQNLPSSESANYHEQEAKCI